MATDTKMAWRTLCYCGSTSVALYAENGRTITYYKESSPTGEVTVRMFSFEEWNKGIPQAICKRLNDYLDKRGQYTEFVENI